MTHTRPYVTFFLSVDWDIIFSNVDDHVGALANAWDALGKATKFDCEQLAPEFFVLGVDKKVAYFHEGASVSVEEGIANLSR